MTIAIVDDELETRQYMQGLVAQYLAETGAHGAAGVLPGRGRRSSWGASIRTLC